MLPNNYFITQQAVYRSKVDSAGNHRCCTVEYGTNVLEVHGHTVDELVINLELTKESKDIAKKLLEYWLLDDYSKQKMNLYIETEV